MLCMLADHDPNATMIPGKMVQVGPKGHVIVQKTWPQWKLFIPNAHIAIEARKQMGIITFEDLAVPSRERKTTKVREPSRPKAKARRR